MNAGGEKVHTRSRIRSRCIVACGGEEVLDFLRGDEIDELADGAPEAFDGPLGGLSQKRLEFGEGIFDGIEIGTVGREVEKACAHGFDQLTHFRPFVAGQIVHDDDVALAQFRDEDLVDVSLESETVDGSVDDKRRDEAAQRQGSNEGRGFPMSVRNADPQALTARSATVTARHVGGGPGLVDEDQALGVEIELPFEPGLALLRDVGAALLGSVRGLFLRVMA